MDKDVPVELPRDVFRLLLDAYREQLREPILRAFPVRSMQRRQYLEPIDAMVDGWRVRYECAEDREGAATIPLAE